MTTVSLCILLALCAVGRQQPGQVEPVRIVGKLAARALELAGERIEVRLGPESRSSSPRGFESASLVS